MNNKTKKGGITRYCQKHGITVVELAEIVGISFPQLYLFDSNPLYPAKISTLNRIYLKTKKRFGDGLGADEFLSFKMLHK